MTLLTSTSPIASNAIERTRIRLVFCCVLFAALSPTAFGQSDAARMPSIAAENLNERAVTLPADLPAEKTLVLMAFEREQQNDVNTWIEALGLANDKLPWLEVPVVGPGGGIWRAIVNGGMRTGIRDEAARERVVTLFTDRLALLRTMGLPGEGKVILALVMNRNGEVLAQAQGRHSAEKAQLLMAALQAE